MQIEDIRLGMSLVTTGGTCGKVVAISKEGGLWLETEDRTRFPVHVECVEEPRDGYMVFYPNSGDCWGLLSEVAKCYKQVEPEQLLLSAEARRVVEYLKALDFPTYLPNILDCMENIMSGAAVMDGLIEAKEAGIVRLDDGKYSLVRESC